MRSGCASHILTGVIPVIFLCAAVGCDSTLETGYKYHKLSSTDADRRAYYAPEFSPESHVPKHANDGFSAGE